VRSLPSAGELERSRADDVGSCRAVQPMRQHQLGTLPVLREAAGRAEGITSRIALDLRLSNSTYKERHDMRISEEFPSQYLKAADLGGREVRVTMARAERETIGQDKKIVLYFKGKEKGLVLNKTNANTIGYGYGDDTDDWYDQPLILFSVKTDYQGKVVDAIRCRIPTAKDNRQTTPERRHDPISSGPDDFPGDRMPDDDIPEFAR